MRNILGFLVSSLMLFSANNLYAETLNNEAKYEISTEIHVGDTADVLAQFDFQPISVSLENVGNLLKGSEYTRQELDEALAVLSEKDIELDNVIKNIEKNAKYAQSALDAFGPAPAEGESEDEAIAQMREKYAQAVSSFKNKIIEANLLKTEISRLGAVIAEKRSKILIGNLVEEQNLIVKPKNLFTALGDATLFLWQIIYSPIDWYKSLTDAQRKSLFSNGWYVLLILGIGLSVGLFFRSFIIRRWGYRHTDDIPRYGQKIMVALVTAIAYGVIPSILIGGCLLWQITNVELVQTKFGAVLASVLYYSLLMILAGAIARVILTPWNGKWRLFNINDERAERVYSAIKLSILLIGTLECIKNISQYYDPSNELMLLQDVTADAIKAFIIILLSARVFGEIKSKDDTNVEDNDDEDDGLSTSTKIVLFSSLFATATFGVSLFGYPGLATFIFNRFFISILLTGIFVIFRLFVSDLLRRSIIFWISTFKLRKKLLSKADFFMSLLVTPVLVMLFIYFLLTLWGVPGNFMLSGLKKLIFGFKVGGIQISLVAIITGMIVFLVSLAVVKMLKKKLSNSLLNRINMDEGIKHSLVSGMGFVGFIISVILAIVAMGVDLSNLAVIAGALSVGIGFGLQDVIKNLVSGIIILFERPFKVGDWVILGGEEGKIKQINIRSTELETWNRRSVIIPNATLISSSLINLTHGNNWQRQTVAVGVSYDSDVELVTKVLLDCAKSSKKIAKTPAPYVVFKDFGASSLDFELRYYISDIWANWRTSSDIRYEILKRFREENIEIAYPQIVVHQANNNDE